VRESLWVGPAAVQRGADRGNEDCVIGQPAIHVNHALDWQPAPGKGVCEDCETRLVSRLDCRRLPGDLAVGGDTGADRPANTGEAERDSSTRLARKARTSGRVVAYEQDQRVACDLGERTGRALEMIAPQGDQHDADIRVSRRRHDRRRRLRLDTGGDVTGIKAASGDPVRAIAVCKDRDVVTRGTKLSTVDRANDSCADNQDVRVATLLARSVDEHVTTAATHE
jgi:hypothetical protein